MHACMYIAVCIAECDFVCVCVCGCAFILGVTRKAAVAPAVKAALYPLLFYFLDLIYPCQNVALTLTLVIPILPGAKSRGLIRLSASHRTALNFCKQLTQPAPVLQPTGKEPI